jgi:NAD(P)-dependent dehydrogenase (short-subunit alcohol dehydrogenase family)
VAETTQLDALDEKAVDEHADAVAAGAGSLDISFNLTSHGYVQGAPMAEMELDDYLRPVVTAVRTTFLTWRACAPSHDQPRLGCDPRVRRGGSPSARTTWGRCRSHSTRSSPCDGSWPQSLELTGCEL